MVTRQVLLLMGRSAVTRPRRVEWRRTVNCGKVRCRRDILSLIRTVIVSKVPLADDLAKSGLLPLLLIRSLPYSITIRSSPITGVVALGGNGALFVVGRLVNCRWARLARSLIMVTRPAARALAPLR